MSAIYKQRFEAVFLLNHPKGPKMTIAAAAKYLKKSATFVRTWVTRFQVTGNVDDEPKAGRPAATTSKEDDVIVAIFEKDPTMTVVKAQNILRKRGIQVCRTTIKRRLREKGFARRNAMLKPLLSQLHVEKRLHWAQENLNRDWSKIIFTDESSFWIFNSTKRVWSRKGQSVIQRTVKHPQKVHVWGCFSSQGFGQLICFTGTLTAERMVGIYKKGLLSSAKKFFGDKNNDWILQEDNDPKHRSRLCREWKLQNGIQTLEWPSQSPDANPIENVWGLMKNRIRGKKIKNTNQLICALKSIWNSLNIEYATKLVESCNKRCQAIIDNNGDWTPY